MSNENVKNFYDALAQDAAFAEELDARSASIKKRQEFPAAVDVIFFCAIRF